MRRAESNHCFRRFHRSNNTAASNYVLPGGGPVLAQVTFFLVLKPATLATLQTILCGSANNSLQPCIDTSGHPVVFQSGVSTIGTSSATLSAGTWYQMNFAYDAASGAYAFRVAQAAAGSGTNAVTINIGSTNIGFNPASGAQQLRSDVAEIIIYNRALSAPEIASVEAYLNAKWGV